MENVINAKEKKTPWSRSAAALEINRILNVCGLPTPSQGGGEDHPGITVAGIEVRALTHAVPDTQAFDLGYKKYVI